MDNYVDLVINTFERTYHQVLVPGFFRRIENQNKRKFFKKIVLINNVKSKERVRQLAEILVQQHEIDNYFFVDEIIDTALRKTGFPLKNFEKAPHYSDCTLVAVSLVGSPWIVYWDAEVTLRKPINWVDPSIEKMEKDKRILVANPMWAYGEEEVESNIIKETAKSDFNFSLGYGFSDQLFLARRSQLSRKIYNERCIVSKRYPLSYKTDVFEAKIDAYMRKKHFLRATFIDAIYIHPRNQGAFYSKLTNEEKIVRLFYKILLKCLCYVPTNNPLFKVNPKKII